jgi:hypothetical protein
LMSSLILLLHSVADANAVTIIGLSFKIASSTAVAIAGSTAVEQADASSVHVAVL